MDVNLLGGIDELVQSIIRFSIEASSIYVEDVCRLSCVSTRWQAIGHALVLSDYRHCKMRCDRILIHFREDEDLNLIDLYNITVSSQVIQHFTNLTSLRQVGRVIPNEILREFTTLKSLTIPCTDYVTNGAISKLVNLTSLDIGYNHRLCDHHLTLLTNLTDLNLAWNENITDLAVMAMPRLASLCLQSNDKITCQAIVCCASTLTSLDLRANRKIRDFSIRQCSCLTRLELNHNGTITDDGIRNLTNLKRLGLELNNTISLSGLQLLTGLTSIDIYASLIEVDRLTRLTNLMHVGTLFPMEYNPAFGDAPPLGDYDDDID
jgi:hypothetical protein